MSILSFHNVFFSYADRPILRDFSLEISRGQKASVMGTSGVGKTTVLRLAAGLLKPSAGTVQCSAEQISVSFQEPRLLTHLTALQNVSLVLKGKDACGRAEHFLELVGLADAMAKYPTELSGGMQTRVSLARSLAYGGDLYLLDEPLSSLDRDTSFQMLEIIRKQTSQSAVLLVTHSRESAESFSKDIIEL